MPVLNRRRFLTITAAAAGTLPLGLRAHAEPAKHWVGMALGARASIRLDHPDPDEIILAVRGEIERLEQIFSLYRANSELSRLNREGELAHPSLDMVELLSLCGPIHMATSGLFDPTIQSVWATFAEYHASGRTPDDAAINAALERVGWSDVAIAPDRISLRRPGMALTLNGIAQGYIADKVALLLRQKGLDNILIDTGEFYALGRMPQGDGWPIELRSDQNTHNVRRLRLAHAALASSSPLGTVFDAAGRVGHIIDPRTGQPPQTTLSLVSVRAPTAAQADAFSTALCLMSTDEIAAVAATQKDIRVIV